MPYKIVLTSDRTMASTYHGNMFFGFSACLPQGVLPDWFYYSVFCPSAPTDGNGALRYASCGLRKIEAALLRKGFSRDEVIVAHPDHLDKVISEETKVLSISANDPLGIGPATSTFVELWGGEGRMAVKLRELLGRRAIKKFRPKIFLGGPGAWQLAINPAARRKLGIDCVVVGEGEVTAPKLFQDVIDGKSIPEVVPGEVAGDEDVADMVGASICGLVEATRGCARSCAFCVPSLKKVRSRSLPNILNEVKVNVAAGNKGVILHGEDILLYASDGLKVNSPAVVELFERVYHVPGVKWVTASHASLSSAVSSPETVRRVSQVLELGTEKHPTKALQVGIETGSPRLIRRHMKGKVYPFKPEEWPEIVREGFRLFHENHFVLCSTLIMGLPGEDQEDVQQTIDLIKSLKPYQSIVVPLLFTPMQTTRLEYAKPFLKKDLTSKHYELLYFCWNHNLDWFPQLWANYGRDNSWLIKGIINTLIRWGTEPVRQRIYHNARKHGAEI
ncbi:MAG: B12-binding domain-containing radical SAM protein [candidate division KSB1 bacterium]|nr:B12-binding domain-containing radical SAM protein [candidate division KSB1 bacterium]